MNEQPYRQAADIEKYVEIDVGKIQITISAKGINEVGASVYRTKIIGKYRMHDDNIVVCPFIAHEFLVKIKECGFCAIEQGENDGIAIPLHRIVDIKFKLESHKIKVKQVLHAHRQAIDYGSGKDDDD